MKASTIWLVISFSSFVQECGGILIIVPSNTAVLEGREVVLKCRINTTATNNSVKPLWRTYNSSEGNHLVLLYTGNQFAANISPQLYNVNGTLPGQSDLRIKSYNITAGRYICDEPGSVNASAELIVLASDPECTRIDINITSLRMQCRLQFAGNWAPVMEWRQVSGEMENETELISDGITNNTSRDTVISTLTVQRGENKTKYTCTTKFNVNGRPRLTTATNVPEYSYIWTYSDDTFQTSISTTGSSSTEQFSTTDNFIKPQAHDDNLKPILISLAIVCILLAILVCITCKKTNEGCKSKCTDSLGRHDKEEANSSVMPNGLDENVSPQITVEAQSYSHVQDCLGTNNLESCKGSEATLPLAKVGQEKKPWRLLMYTGDDGTEYMEMNGFRRQPTTAPPIHPTMHDPIEYARIDHTLSPSPPPKY